MKRLLLLALLPAAALAQTPPMPVDRPPPVPTRDVSILYRVVRGGQTLEERTQWYTAEDKQRVEPPGGHVYMLVDRRTHTLDLVNDANRTIMEMAAPKSGALEPGSGATFARENSETIAGLPCTDWRTQIGDAPPVVMCITADGTLLRLASNGTTLVEALKVTYAPADRAAFVLPQGYRLETPATAAPR